MVDTGDRPEIIKCQIRLHTGRPAGETPDELTFADWSQTSVGDPVTFEAIAITGKGLWNGALPPGVEIAAPVALDDPYWTVFLPSARSVPIVSGRVGRPLAIGEAFNLIPGVEGTWTEDVVFDGAIVID
jgi:hypothetical protein